jgi:hypothetical protein
MDVRPLFVQRLAGIVVEHDAGVVHDDVQVFVPR